MDNTFKAEAMTIELEIVEPILLNNSVMFDAPKVMTQVVASVLSVVSVGNASQHAIPAPNFELRKDKLALAA